MEAMASASTFSSFSTPRKSTTPAKQDSSFQYQLNLPSRQRLPEFSGLDSVAFFHLPDESEDFADLVRPLETSTWQDEAMEIDKILGEADSDAFPFPSDQSLTEPDPITQNHEIDIVQGVQQFPQPLTAFCDEYISVLRNVQDSDESSIDSFVEAALSAVDGPNELPTEIPKMSPFFTPSSLGFSTQQAKQAKPSPKTPQRQAAYPSMAASAPPPITLSTAAPKGAQSRRAAANATTTPVGASEATIHPYQNQKWLSNYNDLLDYKSRHGHCHVPFHDKENPSLSQWVKRQRHQYKCWTSGKHSHLNGDRIKMLEMVGFTWDSHAAAWEENFQALKQFKKEFKTTKVPVSCSQLSTWVKRQRRQYRRYLLKQSSALTPDRIRRLSELGLTWNTAGKPVFKSYSQAGR